MKESESSKRTIVPKTNTDIRSISSNLIRRGLDETYIDATQKRIRILVVISKISGDHIRNQVQFEKDIEIVGFTTSSLQAIDLYKELKPDILLSYTHFEEMDGFQLATEIRNVDTQAKILFLTVHDFLYYIRWSINIGVKGYVILPPFGDTLCVAFREIYSNRNQDYFWFDDSLEIYSLFGDFLPNVELKRLDGMNSISDGSLIQIGHRSYYSNNSPHYSSTATLKLNDIEYLDLNDKRIREIDFSMIKQMKNLRKLILPPGILGESEISWLRSNQRILLSLGDANIRRVLYPGNKEK